jgi:hypothetical protein
VIEPPWTGGIAVLSLRKGMTNKPLWLLGEDLDGDVKLKKLRLGAEILK